MRDKTPVYGDVNSSSVSLKGKKVRHDFCCSTSQFLFHRIHKKRFSTKGEILN